MASRLETEANALVGLQQLPFFCYPVYMNVPLTPTPITRAAEGLERRAFTVQDVIRMVETGVLGRDERFELIGGEIVPKFVPEFSINLVAYKSTEPGV